MLAKSLRQAADTIRRRTGKSPNIIVCLQGGGVRGIPQAQLLAHIEDKTKMPISRLADGIAGTSIGSINAAALVMPDKDNKPLFQAGDLAEMLEVKAPKIFKKGLSGLDKSLIPPAILINGLPFSYMSLLNQYRETIHKNLWEHSTEMYAAYESYEKIAAERPDLAPSAFEEIRQDFRRLKGIIHPNEFNYFNDFNLRTDYSVLSILNDHFALMASGLDGVSLSALFAINLMASAASAGFINPNVRVHPFWISPLIVASGVAAGQLGPAVLAATAYINGHLFNQSRFGLFHRKYSRRPLDDLLHLHFGDRTLSEALIPFAVPVTRFPIWDPEIFTSAQHTDMSVKDVLSASAAAPGYFSPVPIGADIYVDGGLFANNPALHALLTLPPEIVDNSIVIAIGTGISPPAATRWFGLNVGVNSWLGVIKNSRGIFGLNTKSLEFLARGLVAERYIKLDFPLNNEVPLDSTKPEHIKEMKDSVAEHVRKDREGLGEFCTVWRDLREEKQVDSERGLDL